MRLLNTPFLALLCLLVLPACNFSKEPVARPTAEVEFGWATDIDMKYERQYPELYADYVQARKWLNDTSSIRNARSAAHSKLAGILRKNPKFAPAYIEMARYELKEGYLNSSNYLFNNYAHRTLDEAEIHLQKAVLLEPEYADAYVLLGFVYTHAQRYSEAHIAFFKAAEIGTGNPWLTYNFAILVDMQGKSEEAYKRYKQLIESDMKVPGAVSAAYGGAINYLVRNADYDQADTYYQERLALFPDAAFTYGNYAMFTLRYKYDYEKAIELARKSLSMRNYGYGREYLAAALVTKWYELKSQPGQSEEAEKAFKEALELPIQSSRIHCRLRIYRLTDDAAEAFIKRIENKSGHAPDCGEG